jgi:hypothetical protein
VQIEEMTWLWGMTFSGEYFTELPGQGNFFSRILNIGFSTVVWFP